MNAEMLGEHRARVGRTVADCTQALALIDDELDFHGRWIASGPRPRDLPESAARSERTRR